MNDKRPVDWEHIYTVEIDGKTLEAMKFLADYVLKSNLPSLSAIGAADCLHCFQRDIRAMQQPNKSLQPTR